MVNVKNENLSKIAIKNSAYTFASIFISKIGSLFFTIIIARLLLPELFGAYSLVISIAVIAIALTNPGIDDALVFYVSRALGKNKIDQARSYFRYLLKIRGVLMIIVILAIILTSRIISYNIFNKPLIFIPLLFSLIYVFIESLRSFISSLFLAIKDLKKLPLLESILQFSKIFFSLLVIYSIMGNFRLSGIFLALALSGLLYLLASLFILIKKEKRIFFGKKVFLDKSRVLDYLGFMSLASFSLLFFGSVDILMLGRFVDSIYIGYYRAALGIVLAIGAILSFSGILMPILTQIEGNRLSRGFQKIFRYNVLLSLPATVGVIFLAKYLILITYGIEYSSSIRTLYILSFLIFTTPILEIYSMLFKAKEKVKFLAKSISLALLLNIVLNYILIKILLKVSQEHVLIGVAAATLMSRTFLLGSLFLKTKSQFKISVKMKPLISAIIATMGMVLFLVLFNLYFSINLFTGIMEIILAIFVYFFILISIKEINREDLGVLKYLIKRKTDKS